MDLIGLLTIFALAIFLGFEIITKVPPILHTPLMSGSTMGVMSNRMPDRFFFFFFIPQ